MLSHRGIFPREHFYSEAGGNLCLLHTYSPAAYQLRVEMEEIKGKEIITRYVSFQLFVFDYENNNRP